MPRTHSPLRSCYFVLSLLIFSLVNIGSLRAAVIFDADATSMVKDISISGLTAGPFVTGLA